VTQAANQLHRLASWCSRYQRTHGCWPSLEQLTGQAGDLPAADPWGNAFRIVVADDGNRAWVLSDGPDGSPGTTDDLRSPPAWRQQA
jgi:hypothetical protein